VWNASRGSSIKQIRGQIGSRIENVALGRHVLGAWCQLDKISYYVYI